VSVYGVREKRPWRVEGRQEEVEARKESPLRLREGVEVPGMGVLYSREVVAGYSSRRAEVCAGRRWFVSLRC